METPSTSSLRTTTSGKRSIWWLQRPLDRSVAKEIGCASSFLRRGEHAGRGEPRRRRGADTQATLPSPDHAARGGPVCNGRTSGCGMERTF